MIYNYLVAEVHSDSELILEPYLGEHNVTPSPNDDIHINDEVVGHVNTATEYNDSQLVVYSVDPLPYILVGSVLQIGVK